MMIFLINIWCRIVKYEMKNVIRVYIWEFDLILSKTILIKESWGLEIQLHLTYTVPIVRKDHWLTMYIFCLEYISYHFIVLMGAINMVWRWCLYWIFCVLNLHLGPPELLFLELSCCWNCCADGSFLHNLWLLRDCYTEHLHVPNNMLNQNLYRHYSRTVSSFLFPKI